MYLSVQIHLLLRPAMNTKTKYTWKQSIKTFYTRIIVIISNFTANDSCFRKTFYQSFETSYSIQKNILLATFFFQYTRISHTSASWILVLRRQSVGHLDLVHRFGVLCDPHAPILRAPYHVNQSVRDALGSGKVLLIVVIMIFFDIYIGYFWINVKNLFMHQLNKE